MTLLPLHASQFTDTSVLQVWCYELSLTLQFLEEEKWIDDSPNDCHRNDADRQNNRQFDPQ
jgi:hypothetical protein